MQRPGMDDGSMMMPSLSGSIPSSLSYGVESSSGLPGKRMLLQFAPENTSTFTASNNIVRIPVNSTQFLDMKQARLAFDMDITGTSTATYLDGGAACVIQRLRILSVTGLELERIESYNLLHAVLDQYSTTVQERISDNLTSGSPGQDRYYVSATTTTATNSATVTTGTGSSNVSALPIAAVPNGVHKYGYNQADSECFNPNTSNTIRRHWELKLKAAWFNPTLGKLLPPNVSFVIELTLAPYSASLCSPAGTALYALTNFFLKVPGVMVMDSGFMERVRMLQQRGSEWNGVTYKLYTGVISSLGNNQVQISDRSHSMTALITILRSQQYINDLTRFKLSKRTLQYVNQYQATIGSDLYPPTQFELVTSEDTGGGTPSTSGFVPWWSSTTASTNVSASFSEAKRVFGWDRGLVDIYSFGNSENGDNNGTGVICIDCKSYHGDKRTTSGIDTASQAIPITLRLNTTAAVSTGNSVTPLPIQVDTFAQCDIKFIIMPGGEVRSMS